MLAELVGTSWRTATDGTIWLGADTWIENKVGGDIFDADPLARCVSVGIESAALLPGQTWRDFRVESLTHTITSTGFRTEIATP